MTDTAGIIDVNVKPQSPANLAQLTAIMLHYMNVIYATKYLHYSNIICIALGYINVISIMLPYALTLIYETLSCPYGNYILAKLLLLNLSNVFWPNCYTI